MTGPIIAATLHVLMALQRGTSTTLDSKLTSQTNQRMRHAPVE